MTQSTDNDRQGASRHGRIGLLGATAIGVGGMVGGGIFAVLGTAVETSGGATPVAFACAGVIALLTAYSYTKLSVRFPSQGGTVVFIDRAFGHDLATGSLNVMLWLSYLVTVSLYAVAFGSYAATFFTTNPSPLLSHSLTSLGIIIPTALNLLNAEIVSKSETAVVVIKITLLIVVIVAGMFFVDASAIAPSTWSSPISLVAGGMVIFVAYEGFELIANTAEDVRDPARVLPRAFIGSVVFVFVLYVLVAIVTVGTLSPEQIAQAEDYALAEAARPALGQVGFTLVSVSALLATFSAINATVYGNARLGYTLAVDGELPEILERKAWNKPALGVLTTAGLSLLLANLSNVNQISVMASAGFLIIFGAVNISAVKLAKNTGAKALVAGIGALLCIAALIVLLVETAQQTMGALIVVVGMVVVSVGFELVYSRFREHELRLHHHGDEDD